MPPIPVTPTLHICPPHSRCQVGSDPPGSEGQQQRHRCPPHLSAKTLKPSKRPPGVLGTLKGITGVTKTVTHHSRALGATRSRGQRGSAAQGPQGPSWCPPGLDSAFPPSPNPAPASRRCQVRHGSAAGPEGDSESVSPSVTPAQQPGRSRGSHGIRAQRGATGIDLGLIRVPALFLHNDFPFATGKKSGGAGEGGGHGDVIIPSAAIQAAGEEASSFPGPFTSSARARRLSQAPRRAWSPARTGLGGLQLRGSHPTLGPPAAGTVSP